MNINLDKNFYYNFNGKLFEISKEKNLFERSNIYFVNTDLEQDVIESRKKSLERILKNDKKLEHAFLDFSKILNTFYIEFKQFNSLIYIKNLSINFRVDIKNKKVKDIKLLFKVDKNEKRILKTVLKEIKSEYLFWYEDLMELTIKIENFDYDILKENLNLQKIFVKIFDELTYGNRKGYGFNLIFYTYKGLIGIFPNVTSINLMKEIKDEKVIKNMILKENFE